MKPVLPRVRINKAQGVFDACDIDLIGLLFPWWFDSYWPGLRSIFCVLARFKLVNVESCPQGLQIIGRQRGFSRQDLDEPRCPSELLLCVEFLMEKARHAQGLIGPAGLR